MSSRHYIEHVAPADAERAGRRSLWAYGPFHVSELAACSRRTVRRATAEGIQLHEPAAAVAWALARRGHGRLADQVLETLGLEPRYMLDIET